MEKLYFEMDEAERAFTRIANDLDWAQCVLAEGFLLPDLNIERDEFDKIYKKSEKKIANLISKMYRLRKAVHADTEELDCLSPDPQDGDVEKIDYSAWIPKEGERNKILDVILKYSKLISEECGLYSEEAEDVRKLFTNVFMNPLDDCKADIQQFFKEAYDEVDGNIDLYRANDPEYAELINLTLFGKK